MNEKVKWYDKSWVMWACLLLFTPAGLILLFLNRDKHPRWKIIAAVFTVYFTAVMATSDQRAAQVQEQREAYIEQEKQEQAQEKKREQQKKDKEIDKKVAELNLPSVQSPEEQNIRKAVVSVISPSRVESINYVPDRDFILVKFKGNDSLTNNLTVKGMYKDIKDILKELKPITTCNVDINVTYPMQNKYGEVSEDIIIKATFSQQTLKRAIWDNIANEDVPGVADEWWNHPGVVVKDD